MGDTEALERFRARVQQWQRQRWTLVEYSEDPPKATLTQTSTLERRRLGSRYAQGPSIRHYRRTVWLDADGELHDDKTSGPDK